MSAYPSAALFDRTARLLGDATMQRLARAHVLVFGLGGVGSWCAESLVRSGIGKLTLIDSDRICVTNINRQLQATRGTVGAVKVEAMKARLLDINPAARIDARQMVFDATSRDTVDFDAADAVVDAIDSIHSKMLLLHRASHSAAAVFCSLGAALKLDPTRVRVDEFMQVTGCPLGAKLRKSMRRHGMLPAKPIRTVYSDEIQDNLGGDPACGSVRCLCPHADRGPGDPDLLNHEWCSRKAVINGTLAHMTGIFGLTLAGLVIQHLHRPAPDPSQPGDSPAPAR